MTAWGSGAVSSLGRHRKLLRIRALIAFTLCPPPPQLCHHCHSLSPSPALSPHCAAGTDPSCAHHGALGVLQSYPPPHDVPQVSPLHSLSPRCPFGPHHPCGTEGAALGDIQLTRRGWGTAGGDGGGTGMGMGWDMNENEGGDGMGVGWDVTCVRMKVGMGWCGEEAEVRMGMARGWDEDGDTDGDADGMGAVCPLLGTPGTPLSPCTWTPPRSPLLLHTHPCCLHQWDPSATHGTSGTVPIPSLFPSMTTRGQFHIPTGFPPPPYRAAAASPSSPPYPHPPAASSPAPWTSWPSPCPRRSPRSPSPRPPLPKLRAPPGPRALPGLLGVGARTPGGRAEKCFLF